jgi:uncharacterized RDD family membrane protein YckC
MAALDQARRDVLVSALGRSVEPPAINPYAPPQAEIGAGEAGEWQLLARPGTRFVAKLLDQLLLAGCLIVGVYPSSFVEGEARLGVMMLSMGSFAGLLCLYQWYLITTTGRSLGKRWCGIKIVRVDGQNVDFVSGVLMRAWLPFLISIVPAIGSLFSLVDAVSVFRDDRRCLHDQMAGTKVVEAR